MAPDSDEVSQLKEKILSLKRELSEKGLEMQSLEFRAQKEQELFSRTVQKLHGLQSDVSKKAEELVSVNEKLKANEEVLLRAQEELKEKIADLEQFNKLAVGRELRMVELKERIKELEARLKG